MFDFEKLKNAMAELEEDTVMEMMEDVKTSGDNVTKAMEACQQGMEIVGRRFEDGEYFVGDLIYAGEVMNGAMDIIRPLISASGSGPKTRMILCTVKDDLHDIGKNIVKAILESNDFDVVDLGIDVPADVIVDTAKKENIKIVALSGVLTLALDSMKKTVEAFQAAGMRDGVKIIVGGSPVSESACASIGADEWANSPQKTVEVCRSWS